MNNLIYGTFFLLKMFIFLVCIIAYFPIGIFHAKGFATSIECFCYKWIDDLVKYYVVTEEQAKELRSIFSGKGDV